MFGIHQSLMNTKYSNNNLTTCSTFNNFKGTAAKIYIDFLFIFSGVYHSTFAKASHLWNSLSRSTQFSDRVRDIIGSLLEMPNETRWNSLYRAMCKLKKIIDKLNALMNELDQRPFSPIELTFIDEYEIVMKGLAYTLDQLQSDSASLGMVLPAICKLEKYLEDKIAEKSLKICEPLARFVLWDLRERTAEYKNDRDYILGKIRCEFKKENYLCTY